MIELGTIAKDRISGFSGVAIARTEWLYGCVRYCLAPQALKDGNLIEDRWFDEPQLEIIGTDLATRAADKRALPAAGPRNDPSR